MKSRINNTKAEKPAAVKETPARKLTITQLERRYVSRMRAEGESLFKLDISQWSPKISALVGAECLERQISRSEFAGELISRYMANHPIEAKSEAA